MCADTLSPECAGFTLIELSIVLVIIGLIIGGVLVGQELITAAAVRAQISQIERYNTAANTFFTKYGYLPGDIPDPYASQFGFAARGQYAGEGDGNGVLEGILTNQANQNGGNCQSGETLLFWEDLKAAQLIEGSLTPVSATSPPLVAPNGTPGFPTATDFVMDQVFPPARIGTNKSLLVYSLHGANYYQLGNLNIYGNILLQGSTAMNGALTVAQAYSIDSKIDDGLPTSGKVLSMGISSQCYYNNPSSVQWCNTSGTNDYGDPIYPPTPPTASAPPSTTSCMDNNSTPGAPLTYSLTQGGAGINCTLSFKMQAGG